MNVALWPRLGLAIALALAAGPGVALSCLEADAGASFSQAAQAPEAYVVVHGVFSFDGNLMSLDGQSQPTPPIMAQFAGRLLTRSGFTDPGSVPVMLDVTCVGGW